MSEEWTKTLEAEKNKIIHEGFMRLHQPQKPFDPDEAHKTIKDFLEEKRHRRR